MLLKTASYGELIKRIADNKQLIQELTCEVEDIEYELADRRREQTSNDPTEVPSRHAHDLAVAAEGHRLYRELTSN